MTNYNSGPSQPGNPYPQQPPAYGQHNGYGAPAGYQQPPTYGQQPPAYGQQPPAYDQPQYGQDNGEYDSYQQNLPQGMPPAGASYGYGYDGGYPAPQRYNGVAVAGFILSFFIALAGLICSIIGLKQTKERGEKGRGLAIAGIIISALSMVLSLALSVAVLSGAIKLPDYLGGAKQSTSQSQTQGGTQGESTQGDNNSNGSGSTDNNSGDSSDNNSGSSNGKKYASVQAFLNSPEGKAGLEAAQSSGGDAGITTDLKADGDTLIYEFKLDSSYSDPSMFADTMDNMGDYYSQLAGQLDEEIDSANGVKIRIIVTDADGSDIVDKTYSAN